MSAIVFIGAIQQEISRESARQMLDHVKTQAGCEAIVVCNANGLFSTATKLDEQLEMLFDSGIDLVMVGEQAISRSCARSVFSKSEWPVLKPLNLFGSTTKTSVKEISLGDSKFSFVSIADNSGRVPVELPHIKLDEFLENKLGDSFVIINENGTDYRYMKALAYKYSNNKYPIIFIGTGHGEATGISLKYSDNLLMQCDVGSVVVENTVSGFDPEQWWKRNIDRRPNQLLPKWGALICDYSIVWLENGKITRFASNRIRI